MARGRRKSWAPVVVWFVIVVVMVGLAFLIGSGVWMTTLLVIGLIALAFAVVGVLSRLP
jgi:hypothetical protein